MWSKWGSATIMLVFVRVLARGAPWCGPADDSGLCGIWKRNFLSDGLVSIWRAGLITGPASEQLSGCALSVSEPRGKTLQERKRKQPVSPCRPSHCSWLLGRACFTGHVISILAFGLFFFSFGYLGTHSSVDVTQHCVFTWEQVINRNASWKGFSSSERQNCRSGWEGSNWTASMSSLRLSLYAGHEQGQTEAESQQHCNSLASILTYCLVTAMVSKEVGKY